MSWRKESATERDAKEILDREMTGIVASIQEAQAKANTIDEKTELLKNLKKSLLPWLPMK